MTPEELDQQIKNDQSLYNPYGKLVDGKRYGNAQITTPDGPDIKSYAWNESMGKEGPGQLEAYNGIQDYIRTKGTTGLQINLGQPYLNPDGSLNPNTSESNKAFYDSFISGGKTPFYNLPTAQNIPTQTNTQPNFALTGGNLQVGSSGINVSQLQTLLGGLTVDGKYGPLTQAAVKAFQSANGLTPDGIVGPNTTAMLNTKYGNSNSSNLTFPATGNVGNGVPGTGNGTYTPPKPNSGGMTDSYYTSLSQQVNNLSTQLETERQRQLDTIQQDKQRTQDELSNIRSSELGAINQEGNLSAQEMQKKLDALDLETKRFDENYKIVQGLASQLMDLTTQGNALIAQERGVTGLTSIRNPRIQEAINTVTAATGVIKAGIDVYNGQMNQAQNQLQLTTNTLTSAYSDQIDYYKSLATFYESEATDTSNKLTVLTANEQDFLQSKIASLEADKKRIQDTSDTIQKAMIDKDTALAYASAGVTLNDSPAVINQKLAKYGYAKELADQSNDFAIKGYTALTSGSAPAGSEVVKVTDSKGVVKTYYKKASNTSTANKNYTATNIPDSVASDLQTTLKNNPNRPLSDFFAAFPEVSTSYLTSVYNSYHPKNTIAIPSQFLSAGAGLTDH